MDMTYAVSLVALAVSGACLAWLVVRASHPRRSNVELEAQFDELAVLVERLAKTQRRERMSAVRGAAASRADGSPPELIPRLEAAPENNRTARKAAIRERLRQGGKLQ